MVFRDTKKSKRTPSAKVAKITTLSDELLVLAFEDLPTDALLAVRLSCSSFAPVCTSLLCQRLTTLYLRPTTNSLQTAVKICEHAALSQHISQLVLLCETSINTDVYFGRGWRHESEEDCQRHYDDQKQQNWLHSFRPWPLNFPIAAGRRNVVAVDQTKQDSAEDQYSVRPFAETYATLIKALARLPNLREIALAGSRTTPGFNKTLNGTSSLGHGTRPVRLPPGWKTITGCADTFMIFELLTQDQVNFTHLSITTEESPYAVGLLTRSDTGACRCTTTFRNPAAVEKLARLTSLELTLDAGWQESTNWQMFCCALAKGATHLEHLRLVYRPNAADGQYGARDERSTRLILGLDDVDNEDATFKTLSRLKSLVLIGQLRPDHTSCRPQRPVCHVLDIAAFLAQHAPTLENVAFHNTTFSDAETGAAPHTSMKRGLAALQACERLKNVEWTVNNFKHFRDCKKASEPHFLGCHARHGCGRYSDGAANATAFSDAELMAAVAEEMQVELDGEGRVWDFGEVVRREKGL